MTLVSVVGGKVFSKAIHGADEVRRCWVWVVNFRIVYKLVISSNVLSRSHLVQEFFVYFGV